MPQSVSLFSFFLKVFTESKDNFFWQAVPDVSSCFTELVTADVKSTPGLEKFVLQYL